MNFNFVSSQTSHSDKKVNEVHLSTQFVNVETVVNVMIFYILS